MNFFLFIIGFTSEENIGMIPRVNITVAVKDPDIDSPSDPGGSEITPATRPDVMEWVLPASDTWTSPGQLTLAVLIVFLLSTSIICSNALLLVAVYRFKRLRNPSNYFVASLASADFGLGLLLPPGLYFEFTRSHVRCIVLCLLPYCLFILLCSVALLSITAVAVDRCTSLASPLKYNNIITHGSVVRYIALFWIYSLLLSSFPLLYWFSAKGSSITHNCSFITVVLWPSRVFLFTVLFVPCTLLVISSYGYVYAVARSHARAIFSAELSFRQHPLSGPKYGRTLAGTVGLFCLLWMPFQVVAFTDSLNEKTVFYLGLLAIASAATDPWMYGYRSAEFRIASIRILETTFPQLSGALHKPQVRRASMISCPSHARLGLTPNHVTHTADTMCATFIEIPIIARPLEEVAAAQV
ncbi:trace amine-associated receptor 8a-like [Stegodyphus dumicola]|uniref:trace amine-associated receptor 8a-like n=1 Tax=Stegodyphus dumicola TaxID=202533 RepID=UPI0015A805EA|nr:trace amine-associated receptor 8a-like [Stegodyphus dumicola]